MSLAGLLLFTRIPARGHLLTDILLPSVVVGLGAGLVLLATTVAAMAGVAAAQHGVASALLNVSRQLGGALGLAVIATVVTSVAARTASTGPAALTAGFRAGFGVSAALLALAAVTAAALLRGDGRGERVDVAELQAGEGVSHESRNEARRGPAARDRAAAGTTTVSHRRCPDHGNVTLSWLRWPGGAAGGRAGGT